VRVSLLIGIATATTLGGFGFAQAPKHLNPMIDLHAARKPVFGLYAPSNPRVRPGGPGGAGPAADAPPPPQKTQAQLAADALAYTQADFIFDGSMEGDFDRGYAGFAEFVKTMADAGSIAKAPYAHFHHPLAVKTHEIAEDTALAKQRIAKQLNLGVTTVVFVGVESAAEVKTGLAAMRFASKGGTRPDDVGTAPAYWGMSASAYKEKADLWPLNPKGELTNWTIVESKEGLKHVREIAAVKGIAVLFPGAGTLRGVFTTVDSTTKERKFDAVAWEASIQQVLAACKEFNVPCGYPANDPQTVEERMKQGFSLFIAGWGDNGFKAVEYGRKASGR
jgi:2-keto-3-deoxy-L-rhamnonate aldolase RhmA